MEIRLATLDDVKEMVDIEKDSFKSDIWDEDMLTYELTKNNTSIFYVAVIDNQVVGFINVWEQFDTSSIAQFAVKKEYRKQGIATALYNHLENIIREKNIEFITLEVRASSEPAINLYKKLGFNYITNKPGYYKDGEDALYFVKELI